MSDVKVSPAIIAICFIIVFYNLLLIFIYIKNKQKNYLKYFNIFFCISIFLNNIIRAIRNDGTLEENNFWCKFQAILLTISDKLIICLINNYSLIFYFGVLKTSFYTNNQKKICVVLVIISLLISIILAIIFVNIGGYGYLNEFCYVNTSDNLKITLDSIITGILFILSLFCLICTLLQLIKMKNRITNSKANYLAVNIKYHIIRFGLYIIANIVLFTFILLIINDKLPWGSFLKDLIYILLYLIVEILYTLNKTILEEIKRLFTCKKNDIFEDSKKNEKEFEIKNIKEKENSLINENDMDGNNNIIMNAIDDNENININRIFDKKVKIKFKTMTGFEIFLDIELDKTVEEIIKLFLESINSLNFFGDEDIGFLCQAKLLNHHLKEKIGNVTPSIENDDVILVVDAQDKLNIASIPLLNNF